MSVTRAQRRRRRPREWRAQCRRPPPRAPHIRGVARDSPQDAQGRLHPIVLVEEGIGVAGNGKGVDAIPGLSRPGQVAGLHCGEEFTLQIRDDTAVTAQHPVAAHQKGCKEGAAEAAQDRDVGRVGLDRPPGVLVLDDVVGPFLDGRHGRDGLTDFQGGLERQRERVADRILEDDQGTSTASATAS